MKNTPFERSTLLVLIIISIFMVSPAAFIIVMVRFTVGGTPAFFILPSIGIFLIFSIPASFAIIQLKTRYTDHGIEQPSISGTKSLNWQDVQEIQNIATGQITLAGSDTKIKIILFLFKNPQGVLPEIRSRIPLSAFPSDTQINREIYRQKQNKAGLSAMIALFGAVFIFVTGKTISSLIISLLLIAYMIYQIRNWVKYRKF